MSKSKAYKVTKEIEINDELRQQLHDMYRRRGTKHYLVELEHCWSVLVTVGVLIDVKDKDDLKKKLYKLIEQEGCEPYYERDYGFYGLFEEEPRHTLEVKCHYPKVVTVRGCPREEIWMQFKAEEINLIEEQTSNEQTEEKVL